ncbi:hypothetical protein A3H10_03350 [Candidatus Uhrbacteria bacterium RIFCSPLOWO2_12_FULL_46_10]|nr:MAG: hypothetical protein A3E96_01355 [Candidatus Uhrbacteria bacterium RIFCSPHIGHO2_12_FULL_46_13]OGL91284.1 MAG: hypothetical protein A3H10_03350 [Candidatus Uhrbacteria bacterium RIFCSPLOWO2_12_FULL_46_10]
MMAKRDKIILGIIAGAAFMAYSFFPWATTTREIIRFNSPDEAANYFFTTRIINAQPIAVPEPLNGLANNLIHPRSTRVVNGAIVPVSFIGLPIIYGIIGLAFGRAILSFLTPLFTVLALLAAYACWRRLFGSATALLATTLLAIHPAVWYYASRGFYHNALFFDFLIFTWWGYWRWRESKWPQGWLVFCLFALAAALFVRTSEALWVLPIVGAAIIIDRRELRPAHLFTALLTGGLLIIFWFWLAISVYGQVWPLGYQVANGQNIISSKLPLFIKTSLWVVVPFGFSLFNIASNFLRYVVVLFLPFWLLVVGGFLYNRDQKINRSYVLAAGWVTLWLAIYYGSWNISDTVGAGGITVGSSYVRYWLPLYAIWLPYAALALLAIQRYLKGLTGRIWLAVVILLLAGASFTQVFFDYPEGLTYVAERLQKYRRAIITTESVVAPSSVIIGDRADKVFSPERRVIISDGRPVFSIPPVLEAVVRLVEVVPVYFYTVEQPNLELRQKLQQWRFNLRSPIMLPDGAFLYRLIRL